MSGGLWFEGLVVAVGVDGEGSDEVVSVVDVDDFSDVDDPDGGAGPPVSDLDLFAVVADVSDWGGFAEDGVGWIVGCVDVCWVDGSYSRRRCSWSVRRFRSVRLGWRLRCLGGVGVGCSGI